MFVEDFSVFLNDPGGFGEPILIGSSGQQTTIQGIFIDAHLADPADPTSVSQTDPKFNCADTDIAGWTKAMPVTIRGLNYIVYDVFPDGTGMSDVYLHEAP